MGLPLFVYGTLRRGCSNDISRLVPHAKFVAAAQVRGTLYLVGWYPHLILDSSADWVQGELYEVPPAAWATLDALEEVVTPEKPNGEYFRLETVVQLESGVAISAIVYEGNPAVLPTTTPIVDGDWSHFAQEHAITRFAR